MYRNSRKIHTFIVHLLYPIIYSHPKCFSMNFVQDMDLTFVRKDVSSAEIRDETPTSMVEFVSRIAKCRLVTKVVGFPRSSPEKSWVVCAS